MRSLLVAFPSIGAVVLGGLALAQPQPPPRPLLPPSPAGTPTTMAAPAGAPAAGGLAAGGPPPTAPSPAVEVSPPGSVTGRLLLPSGSAPKQGAVYLEGSPSGAVAPREKPMLSLRGGHFSPELLVFSVGQSISISNDDRLVHSVFSVAPAKSFDLGHMPPGETRPVSFERSGVVELYCNIHQTEQAAIVVAASSHFGLLAADGSYQLVGVPAGRYRLVGYSPQGGQLSAAVEVRSRERAVVNVTFGQAGPAVAPPKPR
jgi:hypothetical protein